MPEPNRTTLRPAPPRDDAAFLGEEFLTWLWWRCDVGRAQFELGPGRTVGVTIEPPVVLRGGTPEGGGPRPEQVLRHGSPLRGPEASAALQRGKRLTRARITVGTPEREWTATLDAERLALRGIRVPEPEEPLPPEERALDQMLAFEELTEIVDALYKRFLEERLTKDFERGTLAEMREWVAAR